MSDDLIRRRDAIDAIGNLSDEMYRTVEKGATFPTKAWFDGMAQAEHIVKNLPSAQPESYEEKLKEIADALSEKFAYMNTCLNERDIILGYLGVKRPSRAHCNTDCTNIKCESHRCNIKTPSAQPELRWIPVTERLPKIGEKVLVSTKYTVFTQVFKCIYGTPDRWGWEHNTIKKVSAWMPLPEPWKGAER